MNAEIRRETSLAPAPASASADRDLLLGILALQMDFISRETLLEAIQTWVLSKEVPLAEHLIQRGSLKPQQRQLLEPLLEAHLRQHQGDPQPSAASPISIAAPRHDLATAEDEQLHATLSCVAKERQPIEPDDPLATVTEAARASTPKGTRFRILRPHAEGGLGQVFLARDEEVGRDVALKEIKPRWADHPGSRARFTREAEITGGLEHPGIVPVYGLGAYADGRPFYAMRFIRGTSLKEAIEAFHQTEAARQPLTSTDRNLELRRLLQRLIDVCEAIDYAHSRGVLHRDLKPGNIMLGRYGETLVVDWGLAKALGKSAAEQAEDHVSPLPELPLIPPGDSEPTRLGAAIGTPAFMSPEQAHGRLDQLGPASDVFSLGATLYQLLAGVPPYVGEDLVQQAQAAEYSRPRSIRPDIPRPLEAICLKALEPRPQDRYASAGELADEIERWLAGEPVAVYQERPAERALRWARKNRAWVTAGGLVLAIVTSISTLAFVVVSFQNWRISNLAEAEKDARLAAEQKRKEAETARDNEAKARQEVELARNQARHDRARLAEIVDQLGQDAYKSRRHRPLLESGITHYRDFLKHDESGGSEDPLLRARFQSKLATLLEMLDDYAGAKAAYQASIAECESLLAEGPAASERLLRSELGSTYGNLGAMYVQTPETLAGLAALDKAISIQQKLADQTAAAALDRRELARHYYNRGFIRAHHGLPGAIDDLQAALVIQEKLVEHDPQSAELALELAVMQIELGTSQAGQARQTLAAAGSLETARRPSAQEQLAQARDLVQSGVKRLEELARSDSQNTEYRKELADGYAELGQALVLADEVQPAKESLHKSLDHFAELLRDFPRDPDFQRGLGLARFSLGLTKELAGDPAGAQESYRSAAEMQEQLVSNYPERALYCTDAAKTWTNLSTLLLKEKELAGAMAAVKNAVANFRSSWKLSQYDEQLRPQVYQSYIGLARIAIAAGDHASLAELGESHAALLRASKQDLYDAAKLIALAVPLAAKDSSLAKAEQREAAEEYARGAVELLRQAVQQGFRDAQALRSEPDLSALRSRADFQELLRKLAESSKFKVQSSKSQLGNLEP